MNLQNKKSARSAFTLLEVLLVIVILVTLATLVMTNLPKQQTKARIGTTRIQMKNIEDGLELFRLDVGRYPTSEEGLEALYDGDQIQEEAKAEKWDGPYLKKGKLEDAFGNEFTYVYPGEKNEDGFDLSSNGPDGEEETEDDIYNWEEEDN